MKSISTAMSAHLEGDVTSLATCWKLVRADGVVLRCTDHDADIAVEGQTYVASQGYDRSAVSSDSSLAVDNLDILGFVDSDAIKAEDLRNGLYDYARVEVFLINWLSPSDGPIRLRAGRLGEVVVSSSGAFTAELRGLTQYLSQNIGELYSSTCRADLGDDRCGKVLDVASVWTPNTVYAKGARVVPTYRRPRPVIEALPNMDAENPTMSEWTPSLLDSSSGSVTQYVAGDVTTRAYYGSRFFYLSGLYNDAGYYRELSLASVGLAVGDVVWLRGVQANTHVGGDTGRLVLSAYNDANALLASVDSGFFAQSVPGVWAQRYTGQLTIPTGATKLRLTMQVRIVEGSLANHAFDALALLRFRANKLTQWPVFFECSVEGTSGSVEPVWPQTEGATVTEGAAPVWKSVTQYSATDEVVAVTSNRAFMVNDLTSDAVRFNGGTLEWLTGRNTGRVCEIKKASPDAIELYLPLVYAISVGDSFTLLPGCAKTVSECKGRYGNVLRFRGEPFIPGNDEFFKYPDAK